MMDLRSAIALIRPQQWIKNVFVFVPLFFSGHLFDMQLLLDSVYAFLSFSLAASSIYCLNDIRDVEADRVHPRKRLRPIASGRVSVLQGYMLMVLLIAASFGITFTLGNPGHAAEVSLVIAVYYLLNIAYCLKLKQIAIIDVAIISTGFVLRLVVGGAATGIELSQWIVIMTFLLALYLALAKRYDDVVIYETSGSKARTNIHRYTSQYLRQAMTFVATIALVAYILYTVSPEVTDHVGSNYLYITSVFVLLAILRYLQCSLVDKQSGSPTKLLVHDRFLQGCIACWIITFGLILYL